jgi:ABC-type transport system substrate-binding protein
MAYAFNYTYYIEEVWGGTQDYMYTPVSPGIPGSKVDCDIPTLNITRARAFILDSTDVDDMSAVSDGGLTTSSDDAAWILVAGGSNPVAEYNISHSTYSRWTDTGVQMTSDFAKIGIEITDEAMESATLTQLVNVPANFHRVDIFLLGWGPDYLDPHNMIYDAFAGPLALNPMNLIDNTDFDVWRALLDEAAIETDIPTRLALYETIQCQIMEEAYNLVPWIHLFNTKNDYIFSNELTNYPINPMGDAYYYVCGWDPYAAPVVPDPVAIPGYELVTLFTVVGMAVLFLARKNRK